VHSTPENIHRLTITGYAHDGAGVGRIDGCVVFVPGALQGEEVIIEITGKKRGVLWGKLKEVVVAHEHRTAPTCPVYSSCGGCRLQHVSYPEQLKIKEGLVRQALKRIGGLDEVKVHPVIGMDNPWGYRNKGHFQVGLVDGRVVLGFFEEESHVLVPHPCRHLFSNTVTALLDYLEEILTSYGVKAADQDTAGLRYVLVRESRAAGDILVVFISSGEFSGQKESIAREICHKFPRVVGICHNYNNRASGQVLGEKTTVIRGKDRIEDRLGPFAFSVSVPSFLQVNNRQAEVLYEKVMEYAALTGEETVVDAYCGIGTISLFLAQKARHVIGIEAVREAVKDAHENAVRNKIENVEFLQGEAEMLMPRLVDRGIVPEVIVVDPPRRGCGRELLDSIIDIRSRRLVYVSCNPAALARDLKILAEGGYGVAEVQPVDMFPQTAHVECVVLMSRAEK